MHIGITEVVTLLVKSRRSVSNTMGVQPSPRLTLLVKSKKQFCKRDLKTQGTADIPA
jgi:hypothetical protein